MSSTTRGMDCAVPIRSPAAIVEAVERLMSDAALRERLGRAAQAEAREKYNWEQVAATPVREVYERLCAQEGALSTANHLPGKNQLYEVEQGSIPKHGTNGIFEVDVETNTPWHRQVKLTRLSRPGVRSWRAREFWKSVAGAAALRAWLASQPQHRPTRSSPLILPKPPSAKGVSSLPIKDSRKSHGRCATFKTSRTLMRVLIRSSPAKPLSTFPTRNAPFEN